MAVEFVNISRKELKSGCFPLNHDCILKVRFNAGCPIREALFSCRSFESGSIVLIISELPNVVSVKCYEVDDLRVDVL